MKVLTVTGHRPDKVSNELYFLNTPLSIKYIGYFKDFIRNYSENNSNHKIRCRCGMARGIDTLFAIAAIQLKRQDYPIELESCAIPYVSTLNWSQSSMDIYDSILKEADIITNITSWEERNVYMVTNNCNEVLAIWDGSDCGTSHCIKQAKEIGLSTIIVNPKDI